VTARRSRIFVFAVFVLCLSASLTLQAQHAAYPIHTASPATIQSVDVHPQPNALAIEIAASSPFTPQALQLTAPDRLVFDFPGYILHGPNRSIPVHKNSVDQVRLALFSVTPPVTRIVVDLNELLDKEPLKFQITPSANKIVITIASPNGIAAKTASPPSEFFKPTNSSPALSVATGNHTSMGIEVANASAPPAATLVTASRLNATALQAKAKTLNVNDLQALEDKAKTGDPEAETTLALAYHAAVLLKRNDVESLRLLHQAAGRHYVAAEEALGIYAEQGIGIPQPAPAEAMDWFRKAALQGSLDAETNIALMYADGIGVAKDPAQAISWFRLAADGGEAAAQYNLALVYARGEGTPQDFKESARWLTAAADQNLVPALMDLAGYCLHPPDASPADVGRAIHYYEKAFALGNERAPAILGNIYALGAQGKPDYAQAVKWYRIAADKGQREGEYGLGIRYAYGQGVPADLKEARRLFAAAADQGLAQAQTNLAIMCEEGRGAPADRECAAHYFQMAADQGNTKAQFLLGRLLAANRTAGTDRISAYKWLMLAQSSIKDSAPVLNDLRKSMSEQEISQADREVDDWRIAHPENRQ
jgi:TPR repeat protein